MCHVGVHMSCVYFFLLLMSPSCLPNYLFVGLYYSYARFHHAEYVLLIHLIIILSPRTPLNCACFYGFVDTAADLIMSGADVNLKCNIGRSPLEWAVSQGYSSIVSKIIFMGNADFNVKNSDGEAPLHVSPPNCILCSH